MKILLTGAAGFIASRVASLLLDVGHDVDQIERAIRTGLYDQDFREQVRTAPNPYGDGQSSERIVQILQQLDLGAPNLLQKKLTY